MQTLGALQLLALTFLGGALVGALASVGAVQLWGAKLRELHAEGRTRRLRFWLLFPLGCGVLLAAVALSPSVLDAAGLASDHCGTHPDHHFHLCLLHASHLHPTAAGWIALALFGAPPLVVAGREIVDFVVARRRLADLVDAGRRRDGGAFVEVPSDRPFAFAAGLYRHAVVVSRALEDQLDDEAFEVVRAHERAHLQRRHILWRVLGNLASALHLPPVRRWLRDEYELACEEVCDRDAARAVGDELRVADALVQVERLTGGNGGEAANFAVSSVDGPDLEHRVRSLLEGDVGESSPIVHRAVWGLAIGFVVFHYQSIHHLLETVFAYAHGTFH